MVSSSSEDVTRATRGQPKRPPRDHPRLNGGNCGFCIFSRLFVSVGIHLFCSRLAVHWLFRDRNGNGKAHNGYVRVRYNSLFISLPFHYKSNTRNGCSLHILKTNFWIFEFLNFFEVWRCFSYSVWDIPDSDKQTN